MRSKALLCFVCLVVLVLSNSALLAGKRKPDLEVLSWKVQYIEEQSRNYVVGKARNNSKRTYQQVQVQFDLYDKKGKWIGEAMDDTSDLKSGAVWEFHARVCYQSASSVKFKKIHGY